MGILIWIAIGAVAGWLGSTLLKGGGMGLIGNILAGIAGSFVGGWLFSMLGIGGGGLIWTIIAATVGAMIVLFVISLIKKNS